MAITFSKGGTFTHQKKRDQILILLFFGALLLTSFVLWQGFFKKSAAVPFSTPGAIIVKKVEIRFDVLKGQELKGLKTQPTPSPLPEKMGRENPFVPF
jgi:hypothetical protein